MPFVARLVIVLAVVVLRDRLAARRPAVHEVEPGGEADGRYALLCEGEVVGAIEAARFRMRIRREVTALALAFRNDEVLEIELGGAADGEILLRPVGDPGVDVEVRDGLGQRVKRMRRVIA